MRYVYIDNYRGFRESLIPVKSVNFLVGENSTGKTSILGVLKILSSHSFWMQREFDLKELGLSSYKDAVSVDSKDKSYFTIGTVFCTGQIPNGNNKDTDSARDSSVVILTFGEKDGMPALSSVVSIRNGLQVRVKYSKNNTWYKVSVDNNLWSHKPPGKKNLKQYVNLIKNDKTGYKKLTSDDQYFQMLPPMFLISNLEHEYQKELDPKVRFSGFEFSTIFGEIAWIAPIRSKPRKTYDEYSLEFSPEGDHTPYLIKKQLDSKSGSKIFRKSMEDFGRESGLFKSVQIKKYGSGISAPFELDVVLAEAPLSVNSVGYGVSQALPVAVEIFARRKNTWFAIQQPEVHLHPRAQAAFGEVIHSLSVLENKNFVIETHSDYLIDRFRLVARRAKEDVDSQILYFERTKTGNQFHSILIDENGSISSDQPKGYREFFIKEELDILDI